MKILHLADLHLDHDWLEWIAKNLSPYDLLVIAGDFQNAFSKTSQQKQAEAIRSWLLNLKIPTVVCSGNHDFWTAPRGTIDAAAEGRWLSSLSGQENIVGTDGDRVLLHGHDVVVNGWLKRPSDGGDILVTHAPPAGCACAGSDGGDYGDPELWWTMRRKPRMILAGHIHQPAKLWCRLESTNTAVLVPGFDADSSVPAHWSIDTDRKTALHSSGLIADLNSSFC